MATSLPDITASAGMDLEDWATRACRPLKWFLFAAYRYPAFSTSYLSDKISRFATSREELREYQANGVHENFRRTFIIVAIYLAYSLKNFYLVYESLRLFDYEDIERNLEPVPSTQVAAEQGKLVAISCLVTNCSRLGPHGQLVEPVGSSLEPLALDASKLPLFKMCNPGLDRIYTPATKLDTFGILAHLTSMFTVLLLGTWFTVQQILTTASNDCIMFVVAPHVTTRLIRNRAMELLSDFAISYHNYCFHSLWRQSNDSLNRLTDPSSIKEWRLRRGPRRSLFPRPATGPSTTSRRSCESQSEFSGQSRQLDNESMVQASQRGPRNQEDVSLINLNELMVQASLCDFHFKNKSEADIRQAVDNCMPVVRSGWWRPLLARILIRTFAMASTFILLVGIFSFAYIQMRVNQKRLLLANFGRHMKRASCFVWPRAESERVAKSNGLLRPLDTEFAIDLDKLDLDWTIYGMWESGTFNYMAGLSSAFLITIYFTIVCEINVWLAEVRLFIVATLLVTRFAHDQKYNTEPGSIAPTFSYQSDYYIDTRSFYNVPNLRRHFKGSILIRQVLLFTRIERQNRWPHNSPAHSGSHHQVAVKDLRVECNSLFSKHNDRCHSDRFLVEILFPRPKRNEPTRRQMQSPLKGPDKPDKPDKLDVFDFDVETLEQIYVNFRLLVENIHNLQPTMTLVVIITYLLNYGYVIVGVICKRKSSELNNQSLFIIMFGFIMAILTIFLSVNFHANAKKVQPLIWSIIAQLTDSESLRVRHLRSLWVKQVRILDAEGGLAFKAFGMRITYVYIIQLMIWTSTLFAITLKPRA